MSRLLKGTLLQKRRTLCRLLDSLPIVLDIGGDDYVSDAALEYGR